jgi:hypothetical protein
MQLLAATLHKIYKSMAEIPPNETGKSAGSKEKRMADAAQHFSLINKVALNMIQNHRETQNRGARKIATK